MTNPWRGGPVPGRQTLVDQELRGGGGAGRHDRRYGQRDGGGARSDFPPADAARPGTGRA